MSALPPSDPLMDAVLRNRPKPNVPTAQQPANDPIMAAVLKHRPAKIDPAAASGAPRDFFGNTEDAPQRPAQTFGPFQTPQATQEDAFGLGDGKPRAPLSDSPILKKIDESKGFDQQAKDAGFWGRTGAATKVSLASGLAASTDNIGRLQDFVHNNPRPGRLPDNPAYDKAGMQQQADKMFGVTERDRQVSDRAGFIEHQIAGAAGLPAMFLDPLAAPGAGAATLGTSALAGRIGKETASAAATGIGLPILSTIEAKAGPRIAKTIEGIVSSGGHVGTFSGLHAAASYPHWDTDPAGGVMAVSEAVKGGIEAGLVFGAAGAAKAAPGMLREAAGERRAAAAQAETAKGAQAGRDFGDAFNRGQKQGEWQQPAPEQPQYINPLSGQPYYPEPVQNVPEAGLADRAAIAAKERAIPAGEPQTAPGPISRPLLYSPEGTPTRLVSRGLSQAMIRDNRGTRAISIDELSRYTDQPPAPREQPKPAAAPAPARDPNERPVAHAIKTADGKILSSTGKQAHFQVADEHGIPYEQVDDSGWIMPDGRFESNGGFYQPKPETVKYFNDKLAERTTPKPTPQTPPQEAPQVEKPAKFKTAVDFDASADGPEAMGAISSLVTKRGFKPAFRDAETGKVYPSQYPPNYANEGDAARPAPIHVVDGLPSEVVLEWDRHPDAKPWEAPTAEKIKASVEAGFVDESGKFHTRREVAPPAKEVKDVPQPEEVRQVQEGPRQGGRQVQEEVRAPDATRNDPGRDEGTQSADVLKPGKPTKAPASTPKPTEAASPTITEKSTVKPSGSLTKAQIEQDLIYRHEQIKGPGSGGIMDEDGTSASDQGGTRTFFSPKAPGPGEPALTPKEAYKLLPTEIRERMNQKDAEAAGLQITRTRGQAGGEDYVHDAHGGDYDAFIEELKSGGSQVREAKDFFRSGKGDPEAAFLGAIHDELARKKKQPRMGTVEASTLKEGDTFTIAGKRITVEKKGEGDSAYLVLKGEGMPETPVDAMGKIPVDREQAPAKEAPAPETAKPVGPPRKTRDTLIDEFHKAFTRVPEKDRNVTIALADALQKRSGMAPNDWWGKHFAEFTDRPAPKSALRQDGAEHAPQWHSKLRQTVEQKMGGAMTADQLRAMLTNSGVKPEEMEWSRVGDLQGKLTKQQVLDHLDEHAVKVEEVSKGGEPNRDDIYEQYKKDAIEKGASAQDIQKGWGMWSNATDAGSDRFWQEWNDRFGPSAGMLGKAIQQAEAKLKRQKQPTKFQQYQLPGGENYRELLLTMPEKPSGPKMTLHQDASGQFFAKHADGTLEDLQTTYQPAAEKVLEHLNREKDAKTRFTASHWDEPNVLAHIRFNDRTIGGKKVLFVEEIQSDWHQKGREQGYAASSEKMDEIERRLKAKMAEVRKYAEAHKGEPPDDTFKQMSNEYAEIALEKQRELDATRTAVPNAPFKKNWHELAMKRVIRYAAENGYDKVAWTPGDIQNERYDLSKQIKTLHVERLDSGRLKGQYTINARDHGGREVLDDAYPAEKLPDVVGKEMAQKIVADFESEAARGPDPEALAAYGKVVKAAEKFLRQEEMDHGDKAFYVAKDPTAEADRWVVRRVKDGAQISRYSSEAEAQHSIANFTYGYRQSAGELTPAMREAYKQYEAVYKREWSDRENAGEFPPEHAETVRKRAAQRTYSGLDLQVGGSGMRGFYDDILPKATDKIIKKWGGKVGLTDVPYGDKAEGNTQTVHGFDITPSMREEVLSKGQPLFQGQKRGAVQFLEDGRAVVHAFEAADASTGIHELGHILRRNLPAEEQARVDKHYGIESGKKWDRPTEERYAEDWEKYTSDGKAPSKELQPLFDRMKDMLLDLYQRIKSKILGKDLSPEMREHFDRMIAEKEKTDGLPKEPDQAKEAKPPADAAIPDRPDAGKPAQRPVERDIPATERGDAGKPPVDPERDAAASKPKEIGLNKAEQDHWRREFDMSELPDHEVRTHESVFAEVMRTKMHERAEEIAQDALDRGTPLTDMQHAAMQVKFAELANEYDALAEKSRLAKPEQKPGIEADLAKVRERIDVITDAARQAKRENARGMSIGRRMLDRESFRLVDVIKRAEEAKSEGKKNTQALTSDERARFEFTTKRLLEIQTELSDAMKGWERDRAKARKRDAQGVIQRSTAPDLNKYSVDARTKLRQKLSAERADIKKQLLGIGLRVNDVVGVAPEALYLVGRLALNYAREGTAITLEAITKKVQEDLPDLTDEQIHAAITMRDPARQLKAKTAASKRIEAVKKEAALIQKLTATAEKLAAEKPIKAMEAEKTLREGQIKLNETSAAAAARKTASAATKASEKAAREAARRKTRADLGQMRMVLDQIRINAKDSIASGKRLEKVQERIDVLKANLRDHTRALKKDKPVTPEAIAALQKQARELQQEMRTQDTLTDLTEQLRTGQFRIPDPKAAEALPEHIQRMQIAAKKARRDIRIAINSMRPMTVRRGIGEGLNTLRTMKATADMSATLRQGLLLSVRRPVIATKAFTQATRAFFSEHTAEQIDHALRNDPKQLQRDRSGLYLAELDGPNPNAREEAFMSTIVQRIPGFNKVAAASERHMVTHMNLIRAATFDAFAEKHTNATPTELKAWADYVNKASGRGNLGNFAGAATELSSVFFAPRYGLSRIQTPLTLAKYWNQKRVRVEIAKDLAAFVGTGMLALTLAHAAGAGVTLDPRDPDFGKIRIGNTHVDIWAGFQQPARLVARAMASFTDQAGITGKTLTKQEKDFNPIEALYRFSAFKLSPGVTVPVELWTGKEITGQPTTRLKTLATMGLPLLLTDVAEAAKQEGPGAAILAGGSSFFGFGASTYPDSEAQTRRKIRELINAGQPGEAAQARLEWNAKNPDNKISSNPPKPKKD